ncbi:MAG: DUF5662 family protein [Lachnospiraceae bacterium]|jgi:hypothetical protein|nr:DUF5662 family protein [Lachnospiraceae bacterium]MCI1726866.1 DUF5662 family protein [Lachnospiraceae bacterium]
MNIIGHLKTITKHHHLVMCFCFRAGLYRQGLFHDFSKLEPSEFWVGAKYYQGDRSPNNAEREETGVSRAWLHHKGRNRHHYEYWIDYSSDPADTLGLAGARMPRKYVAEMIFDRVSASKVYHGSTYAQTDPLAYFMKNRDRSWYIHPETKKEMEFLLRMWAEKGENETVRYIRDVFLKGGKIE